MPQEVFQNEVMTPNIQSGEEFARQLRLTNRYKLVVCPASFFAKGWQQEHYMAFWERVINTFAKAVHLNDDWQYSNGSAEEFLIGLQSGMPVYERLSTTPLNPTEGITKIREAISFIQSIGIEPSKLYDIYRRLTLTDFTRLKKDECPV